MPLLLFILFLVISTLYSLVGFGGGSSYTAILYLTDTPEALIKIVSLSCNIVVSALGVVAFGRAGHLKLAIALPFIITSIPLAYLGGAWAISSFVFRNLLAIALSLSGLLMLATHKKSQWIPRPLSLKFKWLGGGIFGGILGLLSGLVGIGGGIFLSPAMNLARWATPKQIAAVASLFIFCNSIAGMIGQITKQEATWEHYQNYAALPISVLVGGFIGSYFGSRKLPNTWIRRGTGILVIIVAARIWYQLYV